MPAATITTKAHATAFCARIMRLKLPVRVEWTSGRRRSVNQNALMWKWCTEVAEQRQDVTPADVQAEVKLVIGIPILRADSEDFRAKYDATIRHLTYEQKIAVMRDFDFPVTRLMTTDQMVDFMDQTQRRFLDAGFVITDPGGTT